MINYVKKIWSFRKGKWAIVILSFFFLIALLSDFIANDKPLYCTYQGENYYPILHEYGELLGILDSYSFSKNKSWHNLEFDRVIYPIVKFSSSNIDLNSSAFSSPGTSFQSGRIIKKHWLGSDPLGRDVAAGIIQGAKKTILIAFFAMLISCLIGFTLGIFSGYFGDHSLKVNVWIFSLVIILLLFIWFQWVYDHWNFIIAFIASVSLVGISIITNSRIGGKQITLPIDLIIMRMIEIFKSVPGLFILLALLVVISNPSMFSLIVIIGLLRWTTIARVLRAELLNLKEKEFVLSAKALGADDSQIIWKHLLPNAIPPLLTIIAFGFAGIILLEASISFLGIGLSAEQVTWGSILSEARSNFSAWWLAVFPGAAIFLMVIACNYLGDTLNEISLKSS